MTSDLVLKVLRADDPGDAITSGWHPVTDSSNVRGIRRSGGRRSSGASASTTGEDGLTYEHLDVMFKGGRIYRYFGKGHLYLDMIVADSRGKFVWEFLRRGDPYLELADVEPGIPRQRTTVGDVEPGWQTGYPSE